MPAFGLGGQAVDAQHRHAGTEDVGWFRPVAEGHHGIGVTHDVRHLGCTGRGTDGNEHGAGAQYREQGLDGFEGGPGPPQDPVAGPDTPRDQLGGHQRRAAVELCPIGGPAPPPPVDQDGCVGPVGPQPLPYLGERLPRRQRVPRGPVPRRHERSHRPRPDVIV